MQNLKRDLKTIFLFSNEVVEVPFKTLLQGRVQTTYGTDFDCIAESILRKPSGFRDRQAFGTNTERLDRGLDKAVILTDGYASMQQENQEKLKQRRARTLTVLFGGKHG